METTCRWLLGLLTVTLTSSCAAGEETISLFDGKTLNGWVTLDGKPVTRGWEVVDGTIHAKVEKQRAGYIKTTRSFENFKLEFEWRVAEGGNSGVKYLAKQSESDRGLGYYGCEFQLLDDEKHKNGRTPQKTAGALYGLYAPRAEQKQLKPIGEFNHSKIVVDHGRIEHWLNGKKILEATIGSPEWLARVQTSKVKNVKDFAKGPGVILLQEHLSEAWFKNIRIRTIDTPKPTNKATAKYADYEQLVNQTHRDSLQTRQRVLRETVARKSCWPHGAWGDTLWALAALFLNEQVDDANNRLRRRAAIYVERHQAKVKISPFQPEAATETPWAYFALSDYVRILYLFGADSEHHPGRIHPETEAVMKEALWYWLKAESKLATVSRQHLLFLLGTENHDLTRRSNHYLIASLLQNDSVYRDRSCDDGHTLKEHVAAYETYFRDWPRQRATAGLWFEIGSDTYQKYSWPPLFNLHELAPDPVIRKQFGKLLDLAFIEEAQISVRGRRGGGRSRADYGQNAFESYKNLLYATSGAQVGSTHSRVLETSHYQLPAAAILLRTREFPTTAPFTIRNRVLGEVDTTQTALGKHRFHLTDSALVNYAYRTPHYLLGSTLQNPALTMRDPNTGAPVAKYAGISRQKRWCGLLFDDARHEDICAVYPVIEKTRGGRPQHSHWSVQHKNVIILQRIAPQTRKRSGSYSTGKVGIRFHGQELHLVEERGWVFATNQRAFVGVRFLDDDYEWDDQRKVITPAHFEHATNQSRIVIHAGDISTHPSFQQFRASVCSNHLSVHPDKMEYHFGPGSARIATVVFDGDHPERFTLPTINGKPIDLHPSATWQSPYLNGDFGSDHVSVTVGPVKQRLDFSRPTEP